MSDIQSYNYNNSSPNFRSHNDGSLNLDAHTSTDMKVKRPKITPNDLTVMLQNKTVFSDKEATKRMQAINTDIYEGAVKEKEKHEFSLKRYFTIFGIIALLTAAFAYLRRGKGK